MIGRGQMIGRESKHSDKAGCQVFQKLWDIVSENYNLHPTKDAAEMRGWGTSIMVSVAKTNGQKILRITPSLMQKGEWYHKYPTGAKITIGAKKWIKLNWNEEQQDWVIDTKKLLSKVNDEIKNEQMIWEDWQQKLAMRASNKARIAQSCGVGEEQVVMVTEYAANVLYPWGMLQVHIDEADQYRLLKVKINERKAWIVDPCAILTLVSTLDDVLKEK